MAYIWRNLMQRKVRSSLCLLGVAVPVAMIVALISISEGMRRSLNNYMETSGASLIVFAEDAADVGNHDPREAKPPSLDRFDRKQGVIDRSKGGSCHEQDRQPEFPGEVGHRRLFIQRDEQATGPFDDHQRQ